MTRASKLTTTRFTNAGKKDALQQLKICPEMNELEELKDEYYLCDKAILDIELRIVPLIGGVDISSGSEPIRILSRRLCSASVRSVTVKGNSDKMRDPVLRADILFEVDHSSVSIEHCWHEIQEVLRYAIGDHRPSLDAKTR
ncbi:hypothetical protein QCA50_017989 [Cerrena zonata]|uniref:Uncharacterized protein n=1 Tax=Cerrena zonata TaxID=2478898 RepID=A0AAW0FQP0_9APHY